MLSLIYEKISMIKRIKLELNKISGKDLTKLTTWQLILLIGFIFLPGSFIILILVMGIRKILFSRKVINEQQAFD